MGLTNFHFASQMLSRAGSTIEIQAMIQEFGRPVYVNYTPFSQETIQRYSWRLSYCHLDQWASPNEDGQLPVTNTKTPDPVKVPKLCISPPLKTPPYKEELSKKFDYIFLVEGNRGANLKLVLQHNHHDAGVALFYEAMNGYSVVFSGVVSKNAFELFLIEPRSRVWEIKFRKAESVEELLERTKLDPSMSGYGVQEILVLC